jgi:hypothetical protein
MRTSKINKDSRQGFGNFQVHSLPHHDRRSRLLSTSIIVVIAILSLGPVQDICNARTVHGTNKNLLIRRSNDSTLTPLRGRLTTIIKYWEYHYPQRRAYQLRYMDQWHGYNYWCIMQGDDCNQYDWMAVYPGILVDPCVQCNNSAYGNNLVQTEAAVEGIDLPEDLGMPEFYIE